MVIFNSYVKLPEGTYHIDILDPNHFNDRTSDNSISSCLESTFGQEPLAPFSARCCVLFGYCMSSKKTLTVNVWGGKITKLVIHFDFGSMKNINC